MKSSCDVLLQLQNLWFYDILVDIMEFRQIKGISDYFEIDYSQNAVIIFGQYALNIDLNCKMKSFWAKNILGAINFSHDFRIVRKHILKSREKLKAPKIYFAPKLFILFSSLDQYWGHTVSVMNNFPIQWISENKLFSDYIVR